MLCVICATYATEFRHVHKKSCDSLTFDYNEYFTTLICVSNFEQKQ